MKIIYVITSDLQLCESHENYVYLNNVIPSPSSERHLVNSMLDHSPGGTQRNGVELKLGVLTSHQT